MPIKAHAFFAVAALFFLCSCGSDKVEEPAALPTPQTAAEPAPRIDLDLDLDLDLVKGQSIFVPAYSEILFGQRTLSFSLSLAIHNADMSGSLTIKSARHYDTDGVLIREYAENPVQLPPLATKVFSVEVPESGRGLGANFIVEWASATVIHEPVVEAVMLTSLGTHGFSVISPGRVLRESE